MKLSRTTIIGLALALAAIVLLIVVSSRSTPDQEGVTGDNGKGGEGSANFSGTTSSAEVPQRRAERPELVSSKVLSARELEMLWAPGRSQELLAQLDRVSANKDPEYWREIGSLLVKHAKSEGRTEIANYLLVTGDAAPDSNLRVEIYAAAMDNRDEGIKTTAKLELENMTGQQFASGDAARAWLAANPQEAPEMEEMSEDQ